MEFLYLFLEFIPIILNDLKKLSLILIYKFYRN